MGGGGGLSHLRFQAVIQKDLSSFPYVAKGVILVIYQFFFDSHQRHKIDEVLKEMGVEKQTSESDIEVLQRVCAAVSIRAARLAAAGIASIAKVCIVNL